MCDLEKCMGGYWPVVVATCHHWAPQASCRSSLEPGLAIYTVCIHAITACIVLPCICWCAACVQVDHMCAPTQCDVEACR